MRTAVLLILFNYIGKQNNLDKEEERDEDSKYKMCDGRKDYLNSY